MVVHSNNQNNSKSVYWHLIGVGFFSYTELIQSARRNAICLVVFKILLLQILWVWTRLYFLLVFIKNCFWFWFINQQDSLTNMFADVYWLCEN